MLRRVPAGAAWPQEWNAHEHRFLRGSSLGEGGGAGGLVADARRHCPKDTVYELYE